LVSFDSLAYKVEAIFLVKGLEVAMDLLVVPRNERNLTFFKGLVLQLGRKRRVSPFFALVLFIPMDALNHRIHNALDLVLF
jgi:hypothetical protein